MYMVYFCFCTSLTMFGYANMWQHAYSYVNKLICDSMCLLLHTCMHQLLIWKSSLLSETILRPFFPWYTNIYISCIFVNHRKLCKVWVNTIYSDYDYCKRLGVRIYNDQLTLAKLFCISPQMNINTSLLKGYMIKSN